MRYLIWPAKCVVLVYWSCLLLLVLSPLARPFAQLLLGVTVLLLTLNVAVLAFYGRQAGWRDRFQWLLFGIFHWPARVSEGRPNGRQAN